MIEKYACESRLMNRTAKVICELKTYKMMHVKYLNHHKIKTLKSSCLGKLKTLVIVETTKLISKHGESIRHKKLCTMI